MLLLVQEDCRRRRNGPLQKLDAVGHELEDGREVMTSPAWREPQTRRSDSRRVKVTDCLRESSAFFSSWVV